ncbi:MAG: hypothetical protein QM831_38050 [Kofleriaceae bacterium]
MSERLIATDLAALGAESARQITPMAELVRPRVVVPAVPNLAGRRANRIGAIAAGAMAVACGCVLPLLPIGGMNEPGLRNNGWVVGAWMFILVAALFLGVHRIVSRGDTNRGWRTYTRRRSANVFVTSILTGVVVWFALLYHWAHQTSLVIGAVTIEGVQGYHWDYFEPFLGMTFVVAAAFAARWVAVWASSRTMHSRSTSSWFGLKITAAIWLMAMSDLSVFWTHGSEFYLDFSSWAFTHPPTPGLLAEQARSALWNSVWSPRELPRWSDEQWTGFQMIAVGIAIAIVYSIVRRIRAR